MALQVQTSPLLDIYTINDKPFTGIGIVYRGNQNNPFDLSKIKTRTTFKQGRENGPIEWFYKNGQLGSRGKLKNGKLHGPYEDRHFNGQLNFRGNLKNVIREGLWDIFDENGNLTGTGEWKDQELVK